ncbi:MAG: efflux RND transporter periplasmic adaptor subunit [Myxococcales bacterium]|nr:efflux RND transporter periplasmic adaptor subunit [Myxococcales bacterium]
MKRFVGIFVVLVAALSGVLYWQLDQQRREAEGPAGSSGTIEGTRVDIVPRLGARVIAVRVDEGDAVKAGQVLVELDCTEPEAAVAEATAAVAAAEAGVHAAEAAAAQAGAAVEAAKAQAAGAEAGVKGTRAKHEAVDARRRSARRTAAAGRDAAQGRRRPENQLDEAQTMAASLTAEARAIDAQIRAARATRDAAGAQIEAATRQHEAAQARAAAVRQDVARARAGLARAQALAAECVLKAPTDGYVQTRAVEPGELARPGFPLLTVIDTRTVTASFYIANAELAEAKPGREVTVKADAWPDRSWTGTIARVGVEAEFTPRNVQTRSDRDRLVYPVDVTLANADGALRPGMPVEVTVPGTEGPR